LSQKKWHGLAENITEVARQKAGTSIVMRTNVSLCSRVLRRLCTMTKIEAHNATTVRQDEKIKSCTVDKKRYKKIR
jgi:hypothetical protein